jgi:hypothetical protein
VPRYFFHVTRRRSRRDEEGVELPGPEEARAEAVVATGEALRDLGGAFWAGGEEWRMTVTDWRGSPVCVLRVAGARQPLA